MGPLVPVLPAFTLGNGAGSLRMKSGLRITFIVKDWVDGAGPALVVACRVTLYGPGGVVGGTLTVAVMFTGDEEVGFTVALGVNPQLAPVIGGLKPQLTVTL